MAFDLIGQRLANHRLAKTMLRKPEEVVAWMGVVQLPASSCQLPAARGPKPEACAPSAKAQIPTQWTSGVQLALRVAGLALVTDN